MAVNEVRQPERSGFCAQKRRGVKAARSDAAPSARQGVDCVGGEAGQVLKMRSTPSCGLMPALHVDKQHNPPRAERRTRLKAMAHQQVCR
eukprot:357189-Chlamydomonas_euryale.AAC.2